jgi:hypothetical protein
VDFTTKFVELAVPPAEPITEVASWASAMALPASMKVCNSATAATIIPPVKLFTF